MCVSGRVVCMLWMVAALWGCSLPESSAAWEVDEGSQRRLALDPQLRARCLALLREGIASDEFWPSIHAAEALTLAGEGPEVLAQLAPRLGRETDDQRRCGLAREMVRAGDRTKIAVLLSVLAGSDPHGHVHAAESLYKVAEVGDGTELREKMTQTDRAPLRIMAAAALARCGNPAALALLRQRLGNAEPDEARLAAWVLGRIGDSADIAAIRAAGSRGDLDPLARSYFDHALAALGDSAGLEALEANLASEDPSVRTYAATFAGDARAVGLAGKLTGLLADTTLDVRIRAAQSLAVLSRPAPLAADKQVVADVYPATDEHPRYSEGSIVCLADGRLLYAVTEFVGGSSDFSAARIVARESADDGQHWSSTRTLQENTGERNVMSVTLRYLASPIREDTPLGMFYLVKNSEKDLQVFLRLSRDGARTFGTPIPVSKEPGYHVLNNDRVVLLSTGRLVAPVAATADVRTVNHFLSHCFLSDDGGGSWRRGKGTVDFARRGAMEPEVIELRDGRLAMIIRTQLGFIAISYSTDQGETWSEPVSWNVVAPEAPATLRKIPATGDWLLVWNDTFTAGAGHGGKRTPLTAAVSTDEGRTWKHKRNLETRDDETYAYTSLTFVRNRALLTYYVRDEKSGKISSRFRSVPVRWFYEDSDGAD